MRKFNLYIFIYNQQSDISTMTNLIKAGTLTYIGCVILYILTHSI